MSGISMQKILMVEIGGKLTKSSKNAWCSDSFPFT
jgi:hypothetical protein